MIIRYIKQQESARGIVRKGSGASKTRPKRKNEYDPQKEEKI
jgi:hypothetical protein